VSDGGLCRGAVPLRAVVGSLSDAFGRRPVLLAALAFLAVDYVIMALAGTLWLLILGRTLAGLGRGHLHHRDGLYRRYLIPPEERAARFGLIGAAFGIGFVIGPALGGIAPHGMSPRPSGWRRGLRR
jgi:DHA1 family tetracycline resistance protein-like MFS transporter